MPARRRNRTRRTRGRFRTLYQLLAVLAAAGAMATGCIVFFRVETINVSGNSHYTTEHVIQTSGIESGNYLALLDKNRIVRRIRTDLPYVESVSIRRVLPSTVLITVKEARPAVAVKAENDWWLVNSSGKLLEAVSTSDGYPVLTGLTLVAPVPGTWASLSGEENTRWDHALAFLQALERHLMLENLVSLDCSTEGTFTAKYTDRFTLLLPSTGNFDEYLSMFNRAVAEELAEDETGIFDFTYYNTTGYVHFRHEK